MSSSENETMAEMLNDLDEAEYNLDCYPFTFTPLLLFAPSSYFDKGYSNYNAVAQFFSSVVPVDMLDNVVYEKKNMLYEELYDYIVQNNSLVVCCIDAHFTAFQVQGKSCIYYDPLNSKLKLFTGESFRLVALFLLLKCNYGDSQHVRDNKDHYTTGNSVRRNIYFLWNRINTLQSITSLGATQKSQVLLDLNKRYVLINHKTSLENMSTQQTSNTCYFQTFLFGVLCKVGELDVGRDRSRIKVLHVEKLEKTTATMMEFLLQFFAPSPRKLRPLSNSNVILDFFRYKESPYFFLATSYLQHLNRPVPDYDDQYRQLLDYFRGQKCLHKYDRFSLDGAMSSTPNTKLLQEVCGTEDATFKLARSQYYKYKAANLMFGFNANILAGLESFSELNALRKNQLLRYYDRLRNEFRGCADLLSAAKTTKYRDYYFMPQWEVGQQELVDVHYYTYILDMFVLAELGPALAARVHGVNHTLVEDTFFSTQKTSTYEKMVKLETFKKSRAFRQFLDNFMSMDFLRTYVGLGFAELNPKEKEINSLTQTVFYTSELMTMQMHRQSYDFEKECINQMARSGLRKCTRRFGEGDLNCLQKYRVSIMIGYGYTYSKYNTLMHFLNVVDCYWKNPDLSNIQVFGKDVRALLCVASQKIFFDDKHCGFYHYGPLESGAAYRRDLDLALASSIGVVTPSVSVKKKKQLNHLILTDRVFEHGRLRDLLENIFAGASGECLKTDNEVLNLCLLSLMLDFGLYETHVGLLNLPLLRCLQHCADTRELQVEVANLIYEFDRNNISDSVTRSRVEELIFEMSYKFLVNKDFPVSSRQFKLIRVLNSDPDFQSYVLLCKIYMSLCQINKNVEMDYYKVQCDGKFRIIIPENFSRKTSDYLDEVTARYTFSEKNGMLVYDELPLFDLRPQQPKIDLHRVRLDSSTDVQSMVKYLELSNVFRVIGPTERYLVFVADNVLLIEVAESGLMTIRINGIDVGVATMFFEALSFIPCFKYVDSEDAILFTSQNILYLVDRGGQFATDYYGMKHELLECIKSEEVFVDLNDEHVFKSFKLCELLTDSKTVLHYPDYLLQVPDRRHLIDLLDLSVKLRNVSFFILVLYLLNRTSVRIEFVEKEGRTTKIAGPWREAILYVLGKANRNDHYDTIFGSQFFDLDQHENLPLDDFIDVLCENFTKYQRKQDGQYEIIPRPAQKAFLKHIVSAEEPFHFSEVGSGKTKVVLPLLCQMFLSNNKDVHKCLSRGGKEKSTLVVLVPEHLVSDARTQVLRYCLNLNFRKDYKVYDDIFALLHDKVKLGHSQTIFVTSFNQFKKALTYDQICKKVQPQREKMLLVVDEVDDFLDRNKLVFNICSNKNNSFDRETLDLLFEVSTAAYHGHQCPRTTGTKNPWYWEHLFQKFSAIFVEIQDASKSINKSFGVFNEQTLRHCSTNIVHDIEGYKSLIARPYESVNRAMPGSYYSDIERTMFLTYVILSEDIGKYNDLFQAERKFITFEFWNDYLVHQLDYDDLVYGHQRLSELVEKFPGTRESLTRFLYGIILRRMEIRDKSRSVNSIDVVFNFDCIGFTGTPFIDNYPTFFYIRNGRRDEIPGLIDRKFYAYSTDNLGEVEFQERFSQFQGRNSNVQAAYHCSDFVSDSSDEMSTLRSLFEKEESSDAQLNAIVDLVGVFKLSTIHDIRNLILRHFGSDRFDYIYHIDQKDNSDRVLCIHSENDIQYDEEFYKHMCKRYGQRLREKIFFFVDNRNVIGKDIPFQLVFQKHYGLPLFVKSLVLAHDVDDFSKIWQAMGRSRTMNETLFSIYMKGFTDGLHGTNDASDIKQHTLTRELYVLNCDRKIAGNISSIYLTIIALFNLANQSFYYKDRIVNTFLEKMDRTLKRKVDVHTEELERTLFGSSFTSLIFFHILSDKLKRSRSTVLSEKSVEEESLGTVMRHIVDQKYELRKPSGNWFDELIVYLSGEQKSQMEISYTKQQQKQKQTQKNKNQDSDAMGVFDKKNQLHLTFETGDYYGSTMQGEEDTGKTLLSLPCRIPVASIQYSLNGTRRAIMVYPTLQFLYSHFVQGSYLSEEVQSVFKSFAGDIGKFYASFLSAVQTRLPENEVHKTPSGSDLSVSVLYSFVKQNPQCSVAAVEPGVYLIGMKDQFNKFDLDKHPLYDHIQFVVDEMGFVLYDKTSTRDVDKFGPYFVELYVLMEALSKHEVAQNVMEGYCQNKERLHRCLDSYHESQGKGFICWRFLMNEALSATALSGIKRPRSEGPVDDVADGLARYLDI